MRTLRISSVILLAFTSSLLAQTNEATTNSNPVVAYIYVGNNTKPGQISAFSAEKNGSIESVSGSPFATAASQAIVVSSSFLFGTDGTNIAVFKRSSDGALHESSTINGVAHNPITEGSAVFLLTLDRTADSLYAVELNFDGADNDGYAEFANLHDGKIAFRDNTNTSVAFDSLLHFSENDEFAYGGGADCGLIGWEILAFHRTSTGELVFFDPGNTVPPGSFICPIAEATSAKGFLAVMYGPAETGSKQNIITYRITSTGGLEEITTSVITTDFTNLSLPSLQFDPTGNFLAAAGDNGVEIFKINSEGLLTPLGHVVEPSVIFVGALWDTAGHLYAISDSALYVFTLGSAGLTLVGSPRPVSNAAWLAVLPAP